MSQGMGCLTTQAAAAWVAERPALFSKARLTLTQQQANELSGLIAAIESVIHLPLWHELRLAGAGPLAQAPSPAGVFYGYDFHLTDAGPQLIEINTNAGGGLLNLILLAAHGKGDLAQKIAAAFVAMFRQEWASSHPEQALKRVLIVDEKPLEQFLYPEFEQFQQLFSLNGIEAIIADPAELSFEQGKLLCHGQPIDLVYNRLTDFALADPANQPLREAFLAGAIVMTPNPQGHALYADKGNLIDLSSASTLTQWGIDQATQMRLLAGVPETRAVNAEDKEFFWQTRKQWFFKPAAGFGSRAAYRGDKVTKRVFEEITQGGYIAQEIVPPPTLTVHQAEAEPLEMKYDLRCYVYQGQIQLMAARLYQGQTTNFRTPGGGFAPVFIEEEGAR